MSHCVFKESDMNGFNRGRIKTVAQVFRNILLGLLVIMLCASAAQAIGVWYEGRITQKVRVEKYNRIEINKIAYTCMPEIKVWLPGEVTPNAAGDKQIALLKKFKMGRKVRFKANGHMIYEIMVDEDQRR